MTSVADLRAGLQHKVGESGPMLALVGAADLAAARLKAVAAHTPSLDAASAAQLREQVRTQVQEQVDHGLAFFQTVASRAAALDPAVLRAKLEPARLRADVGQVQAKALSTAVTTALTTAGRVESQLGKLVERGRSVVGVVVEQPAAEQVIGKAKVTVTRARRVVTGRPGALSEDGVADLRANGVVASPESVAPVVTLAPQAKPAAKRVAKAAAKKAPAKAPAAKAATVKASAAKTTAAKTTAAKTGTAKSPAARTARATARPSGVTPSPTTRSRARKTVAKAPVDSVTPLDVAQAVDPAATTPVEGPGEA